MAKCKALTGSAVKRLKETIELLLYNCTKMLMYTLNLRDGEPVFLGRIGVDAGRT